MPLTHTRSFRVRFYECDAYSHLNNTNYLRYMQETAFDASAAAGFGQARYAELGGTWLIRSHDVEYLRPVRYDDRVEVTTWVVDFRRATSVRAYEFRLAGNPELVARAETLWVYLDTTTGRPRAVPEVMGQVFFPEGLPETAPRRPPFPDEPAPPPGVFTLRHRVAWREIDGAGHVNNAVYLEYAEDAGFQAVAAYGWTPARMAAEGFGILYRRMQVEYRLPALLGDELEIATWASEVRRSTATRYYVVRRAATGELLARIHAVGVWVDLANGRPIRIPDHFMRAMAPNLSTGSVTP